MIVCNTDRVFPKSTYRSSHVYISFFVKLQAITRPYIASVALNFGEFFIHDQCAMRIYSDITKSISCKTWPASRTTWSPNMLFVFSITFQLPVTRSNIKWSPSSCHPFPTSSRTSTSLKNQTYTVHGCLSRTFPKSNNDHLCLFSDGPKQLRKPRMSASCSSPFPTSIVIIPLFDESLATRSCSKIPSKEDEKA